MFVDQLSQCHRIGISEGVTAWAGGPCVFSGTPLEKTLRRGQAGVLADYVVYPML